MAVPASLVLCTCCGDLRFLRSGKLTGIVLSFWGGVGVWGGGGGGSTVQLT